MASMRTLNRRLARPPVGELVTVLPHRVFAGWTCGRWNGRVRSHCLTTAEQIWVQEVKPVGRAWELGMTLQVRTDHLVPIELDVDLFGDPSPVRGTVA